MSEREWNGRMPAAVALSVRDSGRQLTQRRVIDLKRHATALCR